MKLPSGFRRKAECTRRAENDPLPDTVAVADMAPDEVRAFLRDGTRAAKLATVSADGRPHVVPGELLVRITPTTVIVAQDVAS